MGEKTLKGGTVGAGAWSKIQLTAWARVSNAEIVALCDRHPDRRTPIMEEFGIPRAFDDVETMLDEVELDFVDICTRPYSHASLTRLVADHGLPILCQKPFCTSMGEAQDTVKYCQDAGVRLMINENFRWQTWYRKAKELLEAGMLGTPFLARFLRRQRMTLPEFNHPQAYFKEMPQLAVYELGVHYLDVFRFLFGEPDSIYARLHRVSAEMSGEDVEVITLGYGNQLTCLIAHSWASVPVPGRDKPRGDSHPWGTTHLLEIDGTKGTLVVNHDGSVELFTDDDHQVWEFSTGVNHDSRAAAQQHFTDCLENGAEFETSGAETLKTMALVYGSYLSAQDARVVSPAEILDSLQMRITK